MNPNTLRSLLQENQKGNFEVGEKILAETDGLQADDSIRIISSCATGCAKRQIKPISVRPLGNMLKSSLEILSSDMYLESYLASVFHVIKSLLELESFDDYSLLRFLLLPTILNRQLTGKSQQYYECCHKLLFNTLLKSLKTKRKLNVTEMYSIMNEMRPYLSNLESIIERSHKTSSLVLDLNLDSTQIAQSYQDLILNLTKLNRDEQRRVFAPLIVYFGDIYVNCLKTRNFETAIKIHQQTSVKIKELFTEDEIKRLNSTFDMCSFPVPYKNKNCNPKVLQDCRRDLKAVYKQFKDDNYLKYLCKLISDICISVFSYYDKNPAVWASNSFEWHSDLCLLLFGVAQILSKSSLNCPCGSCNVKTGLREALKTLHFINYASYLYMSENYSKTKQMKDCANEAHRFLVKSLDFIVQLKSDSCNGWQNSWISCAKMLYNFCYFLYDQSSDSCLLFGNTLIKYFFTLEDNFESPLFGLYHFDSIFGMISRIHTESKDYARALTINALMASLNRDASLDGWIKVKVASRENSVVEETQFQPLTTVSALKSSSLDLKYFKYKFNLSPRQEIDLLIRELRHYKKSWASKVPMMAVYRELLEIGDAKTLSEIFIEIWGDGNLMVDANLPGLLQNTVTKLKNWQEKQLIDRLNLAHLYYLLHKYNVEEAITKTSQDINETLIVTSNNIPKNPADYVDPNDKCDIVTSYSALRLNRYTKLLHCLNKAVGIIYYVMSGIKKQELDKLDVERVYRLLKLIANEYRLQANITCYLQVWEMALKLSQIVKDHLKILEASSSIIEFSDVSTEYFGRILAQADKIVASLDVEVNLKEFVGYHLSRATAFLYLDFAKAYQSFLAVYELRDRFEENFILTSRFQLLHYKLILLPCEFKVEEHKEQSMALIYTAYNNSLKHYNSNTSYDVSYDVSLFFDIVEVLAQQLYLMRLPRELRCYIKELVLVAQKMVLPFRTLSLLFYLSYADIISCRLDDGLLKISGMSDILCLSRTTMKPALTPLKMFDPLTEIPNIFDPAMDRLTENIQELVLDSSMNRFYSNNPKSPGSPQFPVDPFKFPSALEHEESCECFYCTSVEFYYFVLKKIYLNALYHVYERNDAMARQCFEGAFRLYGFLIRNEQSFQRKVAKKLSKNMAPLRQKFLFEIYGLLLLEFGNFFLRLQEATKATSINNKLISHILPKKTEFIYLYNEAVAQKLNILLLQNPIEVAIKPSTALRETGPIEAPKTPENHKSTITVPTSSKHVFITPKRPVRPVPVKFDIESGTKSQQQQQQQRKIIVRPTIKTPAPSLKIEQDANGETDLRPISPNSYTQQDELKSAKKISKKKIPKEPEMRAAPSTSAASSSSLKEGTLGARKKLLTDTSKSSTDNNLNIRKSKRNKKLY